MKTAYFNGYVYTGDWPLQEAFLVEDGVFTKTGQNAAILGSLAPGDAKVDLEGRFVCAGFNDSHMHLLNFGQTLHGAQLAAVWHLRPFHKKYIENDRCVSIVGACT